MATGYRIHPREMTQADCHERHVSRLWVGEDDSARPGLSVCASYADLVRYFAGEPETSRGRGAWFRGACLVVLDGEDSGAAAYEDCYGESLVHPTRVVSCEPATAQFVSDLIDRINDYRCGRDERAVYDEAQDAIVIERRCSMCDGSGRDDEESDGECHHCDGGWIR